MNDAITLFVTLFALAQLYWWSIALWETRPSAREQPATIEREGWWSVYWDGLKRLSPTKNVFYTTVFSVFLTGFYIAARWYLGEVDLL